MTWIHYVLLYIGLGGALSFLQYVTERIGGIDNSFDGIGAALFFIVLWPVTMFYMPSTIAKTLKEVKKPKIQPIEKRRSDVASCLDALSASQEFSTIQISMIRKWYGSEIGAPAGGAGFSIFPWVTDRDVFDYLLSKDVSEFPKAIEREYESHNANVKEARKVARFTLAAPQRRLRFSNIFLHSFDLLNERIRPDVVKSLKNVAPLTRSVRMDGWPVTAGDMFKHNGPLPCLLLAEGVAMVFEPIESGIVCVGFIARVNALVTKG